MTTEEAVKAWPHQKELLEKKLTYHEFVELLTDAWMETAKKTGIQPSDEWRLQMATILEGKIKSFVAP
jgi:hypothetical protein